MLLHRRSLVLVVGVALALAVAFVLPKVSMTQAPLPVVDRETEIPDACAFPVLLVENGKQKVIEGPGILIFPGLQGTLTNLADTVNQLTLVEPGTGRGTLLENGDLLVEATGRNILIVPGEGIFQTIGRVEFTLAPPYDVGSELTILENQGQLIDVCALLE